MVIGGVERGGVVAAGAAVPPADEAGPRAEILRDQRKQTGGAFWTRVPDFLTGSSITPRRVPTTCSRSCGAWAPSSIPTPAPSPMSGPQATAADGAAILPF